MAALGGPGATRPEDGAHAEVVQSWDGDTLVVRVSGEMDLTSVPAVRDEIEENLTRGPSTVAFDLDGLRFIDSSGIALLVTVAARVQTVEIRNPSAIIRRVIEITGLTTVLRMTP